MSSVLCPSAVYRAGRNLRAVIPICLSFITLLGPAAFCCCTTRVLADALNAQARPAVDQATAPQTPTEGCCRCKQHAQTAPPVPAPAKAPSSPCPCKERGQNPVLAEQDAAGARVLALPPFQAGFVTFDALPWDDLGLTASSGICHITESGRRPFLSAQDLLCAHHLLRC